MRLENRLRGSTRREFLNIPYIVYHNLWGGPGKDLKTHLRELGELGLSVEISEGDLKEIFFKQPSKNIVGNSIDRLLKVSSWNVQFDNNFNDILDVLTNPKSDLANSDIIALQEVTRFIKKNGYKDLPAIIAKETGFGYVYGKGSFEIDSKNGIKGELGNMILSRHPISDCKVIRLSSEWYYDSFYRLLGSPIAIRATVTKNGKSVVVYCAHLYYKTTPWHRGNQMKEILKDADNYKDKPIIITGDFNLFEIFGREYALDYIRQHKFDDPIGKVRKTTMNYRLADIIRWLFGYNGVLDRDFSIRLDIGGAKVPQNVEVSDHHLTTVDYRF